MPPAPRRIAADIFELSSDARQDMRVPVRIVADSDLLSMMLRDRSFDQLMNVSTLPGITRFAIGMPDMHEGYGFPVGGVAATQLPDGVISPGGIGFDINCGVRLLASPLDVDAVREMIEPITHELSRSIPTGYGRHGRLTLSDDELERVLNHGCEHVIRSMGLGVEDDLVHIESGGRIPGADARFVSARARDRGRAQLGTLGGGNHFLEIGVVARVFDEQIAAAFGLAQNRVTVLIHTGSRGLGHQVCTDYVRAMDQGLAARGVALVDRQLACAPLSSPEGKEYFAAMSAAANFAFSNRQVLTHRVREAFRRILGDRFDPTLRLVYDLAHNIAKIERHGGLELCVHRKGATRAFGPSSVEIPPAYRGFGQPVFIPGSMGTSSFVLAGTDASSELSLGSACHGAGRVLSRAGARRQVAGQEVRKALEAQGIVVRCPSNAELAEEAPFAYKDVERVVDVIVGAGIARKVAQLRPLGVLKG